MKNQIQHHYEELSATTPINSQHFRIPMRVLNSQKQEHKNLIKFCTDQQINQHKKKLQIKISKSRLPSDFFGPSKPTSTSASLPQRAKKGLFYQNPLPHKNLKNQSQLTTGCGQTEDEEDNQMMKLTSYFGSIAPTLSPQKNICLTERKYQTQKDIKAEEKYASIPTSRQNSVQRRKVRSIGKVRFFNNNIKLIQIKHQIQLPPIKTNPIAKRNSHFRKFSDDYGSQINPQLQKKISALMSNSSLPPQIGALLKPEGQAMRLKLPNSQANADQVNKEMNVTFCSPEKKSKNFFEQ